jgi:hypothetical protein
VPLEPASPQETQLEYSDLITFKTYPNQAEAEVAKSFLASHGIDAVLSLSHFGSMPGVFKYSVTGVRLLIKEQDLRETEAIFKSTPTG